MLRWDKKRKNKKGEDEQFDDLELDKPFDKLSTLSLNQKKLLNNQLAEECDLMRDYGQKLDGSLSEQEIKEIDAFIGK